MALVLDQVQRWEAQLARLGQDVVEGVLDEAKLDRLAKEVHAARKAMKADRKLRRLLGSANGHGG